MTDRATLDADEEDTDQVSREELRAQLRDRELPELDPGDLVPLPEPPRRRAGPLSEDRHRF